MEKTDRLKLSKISLSGFKSFNSDKHEVHFGDVTVLIGANGAGKSSLISFFEMLHHISTDTIEIYVGEEGLASSILHYGPKVTPQISQNFEVSNDYFIVKYGFTLNHSSGDRLIFTEEFGELKRFTQHEPSRRRYFTTGNSKTGLVDSRTVDELANKISYFLAKCLVYQFHDTSSKARIRNGGYLNDNQFLRQDAGNLASYLFALKENDGTNLYYNKILRHVKAVFPQFGDFVLRPSARNERTIILDWAEGSRPDYIFGPHQLSDGTLRFIALATLLLQPPHKMPLLMVIDEPELGLHPSAIIELAAMVKMASQHTQIILATQSPAFLDEFEPEQVVVIERDPITQSSIFKEFTSEQLVNWLSEYSLSEIWDKNILGGKP